MASYFFGSPDNVEDTSANGYCFDSLGMDLSVVPTMPEWSAIPSMLILAGVGMRTVNIIIMSFDVYLVGVYLSENAVEAAQGWDDTSGKSLSETLMPSIPATPEKEAIRICMVIQFRRAVSKADFLTAFDTAMTGCEQAAINTFLVALGGLISEETGIVEKEEVHFYFLENGEFAVKVGGSYAGPVSLTRDIYLRLVEVYIDPSRTVSPALSECIHDHIADLEY